MNNSRRTEDRSLERNHRQVVPSVDIAAEMLDTLYDTLTKIVPIHKGWSKDKKYYAETKTGDKLLIRISDMAEYEAKKQEFEWMTRISESGIKMSQPIDFGIGKNGKSVVQVLSWCEGDEAKEVLPSLPDEQQYAYGRQAAEIMRSMESIHRKPSSKEWEQGYKERVEHYIDLYRHCGYTFEGDEVIISVLRAHGGCIGQRPMSLMHEDFQTDNMVISPAGELYTIDFQQCGMVDPYYAMMSVGVSAMYSVPFARGQIDGYFGTEVPTDFWEKYTYYLIAEMLYAYTVAVTMEEERAEAQWMFADELERIQQHASFVPHWYR